MDIPVRRGEKQSWGLYGSGLVSNYLPFQPRLLGSAEMVKNWGPRIPQFQHREFGRRARLFQHQGQSPRFGSWSLQFGTAEYTWSPFLDLGNFFGRQFFDRRGWGKVLGCFKCSPFIVHSFCSLVAQSVVYLQRRRPGFNPWVGKISWRRKWQPTPVFLPEEFNGLRSLVGYKGLDTAEWTNTYF